MGRTSAVVSSFRITLCCFNEIAAEDVIVADFIMAATNAFLNRVTLIVLEFRFQLFEFHHSRLVRNVNPTRTVRSDLVHISGDSYVRWQCNSNLKNTNYKLVKISVHYDFLLELSAVLLLCPPPSPKL